VGLVGRLRRTEGVFLVDFTIFDLLGGQELTSQIQKHRRLLVGLARIDLRSLLVNCLLHLLHTLDQSSISFFIVTEIIDDVDVAIVMFAVTGCS
jgi:hypothetical protein